MLASLCEFDCRDASRMATTFPAEPVRSTSLGTRIRDDGVAGTSTLRLPPNGTVGLYSRESVLCTNGAAPFLVGFPTLLSSSLSFVLVLVLVGRRRGTQV